MKWKFWKRKEETDDEATIRFVKAPGSLEVSVTAKTSEKTLELWRQVREEVET